MAKSTITTVTAVFFSATGTTEKICNSIAEGIAARLNIPVKQYDFTLPQMRQNSIDFSENDLVVIGLPTYAGRLPNVLLPYLTEKICGNGALAVPIVLYGNRDFDDSLAELCVILRSASFRTIAAAAFVGEHSFSRILAAGRPDASDIAKAEDFASSVAALVMGSETADIPPSVQVRGEDSIRPYYTPRDRNGTPINILKVKPEVSDDCTACGICARVCPMGSISRENIREYVGICIKCGACVKKCPAEARYYTDSGYLYHKSELEEMYAARREPELFGV